MTRIPPENSRLTRLIDAELRALPPQRAPASLQQRVLARLAGHAARAWWQRSFREWPLSTQAAFAIVAPASIQLALHGLAAGAGFWLHGAAGAAGLLEQLWRDVLAALPDGWVMGAALALVGSALLVVGGTALLCRSLRLTPHSWKAR